MHKNRIIVGIILLAAAIGAWLLIGNVRQPSMAITCSEPKIIAPAHIIPSDVSQNMQEALAEREKKLQELSQNQPVSPNNGH